MRRRFPWWVLALLFVVVPIAEISVLIQVGQVLGALPTILLLVLSGILGSYLLKQQGSKAWSALQTTLASHQMPARELADGALIVVGGTLLLTPGFITDAVGLFCILPFTRPLARRGLTRVVSARLLGGPVTGASGRKAPTRGRTGAQPRPGTDESVVRGEVVND